MKTAYKAHGRKFLEPNSTYEHGAVCWGISVTSYKEHRCDIGSTLNIRDCSKNVGLCFDSDTAQEAEDRLAKLDDLIDQLNRFRVAYVEAKETMETENARKSSEETA